ncbi:unnamed protein product, partial [Prorocentrum cordatum]
FWLKRPRRQPRAPRTLESGPPPPASSDPIVDPGLGAAFGAGAGACLASAALLLVLASVPRRLGEGAGRCLRRLSAPSADSCPRWLGPWDALCTAPGRSAAVAAAVPLAEAEGLRVFVAGIPWKIDEEVLKRDFEECGAVEDIFLLRDHEGNSKGRAFITFRDSAAVEAALKFDNTPYGGRTIFVKVANEKKKGTPAGKADAAKGPVANKVEAQSKAPLREAVKTADRDFPTDKATGCVSLCLKNIGDATQADVRTFLKDCLVQSVRIVTDRKTGMARGIAFVDFPATEEVDEAMARNGKRLHGLAVALSYEAPRERPRPEGCTSVAAKKLGPHTTENQIRKLFRGLESLSEVRLIPRDPAY